MNAAPASQSIIPRGRGKAVGAVMGASIGPAIANTFQEVSSAGLGLAALLYLALILFIITLAVNAGARLLVARQQKILAGTR